MKRGVYEHIRQENIGKYGTDSKRVMKIIINQYSDRTHFIYEILQNAEDAEATYLKFKLCKNELVIIHNGRPFNEKDIIGVCGIADGTKSDGSRIGHFGIGFKSIYSYTNTPQIYSGEYTFEIQDQLFPNEIDSRKLCQYEETCFVLPFDKPEVTALMAYSEIQKALSTKLNQESVLILNNINCISVEVGEGETFLEISKEKRALDFTGNVFEANVLMTRGKHREIIDSESENNYLYFTDGETEACTVIFAVHNKSLLKIKNSKVYAFFPTAKEAHQNFYIHAPFDTTPARDNFKEGAEYGKHNIVLAQNIGEVIYFAFCWLRDNGYLTIEAFNIVYPIYEYDKEDALYAIYQKAIDIISSGEKILPTNQKGVFKSINEICVPANMNITTIFEDSDVQRLFLDHNKFWLAKEISTAAYNDIRVFLYRNFEFQTYEWKDLVSKLNARYLEMKSVSWIEKLLYNIMGACIKRSGEQSSHYINAQNIPLVRLSNGDHICAKENGEIQVYLNNPDGHAKKIHVDMIQNEHIKSFYSMVLGIHDYNLEERVRLNILPKYISASGRVVTKQGIEESIEDLMVIKNAIYNNPSLVEHIKASYIVTDGKKWYKPNELYVPSQENRVGYSLFNFNNEFKFLDIEYIEGIGSWGLDTKFYTEIGCALGAKPIQVSKLTYLEAVRTYCDLDKKKVLEKAIFSKKYISDKFDWGFSYENMHLLFQSMTKEKSIEIARFLNWNAVKFEVAGQIVASDSTGFNDNKTESVLAHTMIGIYLTYEKWLYKKDSDIPQRSIDIDKDDLADEYKEVKRIINMLEFKEENSSLNDWINESIPVNDREAAKKYFSNPEQVAKIVRAMAKQEAKEYAKVVKKSDILSRLQAADKKQRESYNRDEEFNVAPISSKGLAKRSESLDKVFRESMDNRVKVTRGLTFSYNESNKEERVFLEQEYGGYCQICQKRIIQHNGKSYFEAINIIKQRDLLDQFTSEAGIQTGWNSLSLCPNCAAEYNYCSKNISQIYEQVKDINIESSSDEAIRINIELPVHTKKEIMYSPRHLLALQRAFEIYTVS